MVSRDDPHILLSYLFHVQIKEIFHSNSSDIRRAVGDTPVCVGGHGRPVRDFRVRGSRDEGVYPHLRLRWMQRCEVRSPMYFLPARSARSSEGVSLFLFLFLARRLVQKRNNCFIGSWLLHYLSFEVTMKHFGEF